MELGLHIADFTWHGGAANLGRDLARVARGAEQAGLTRITVMDHFWQLGAFDLGPYESDMLESYSTLSYLAAVTETVRLHTLVTGVTYREPALLAKQVSTLDVLSGGRAGLGIGAGWFVEESEGLGFSAPSTRERFERLEETIQICLQMWSESEQPFAGDHYQLGRTLNRPQPLQAPRPYLLIGGEGEKRTLLLVARYADACNIAPGPLTARKLDVLRRHCDDVGRDYDEIEKTTMFAVNPRSTVDDVVRTASSMRELGFTAAYLFAQQMPEPQAILDLLGPAAAELV